MLCLPAGQRPAVWYLELFMRSRATGTLDISEKRVCFSSGTVSCCGYCGSRPVNVLARLNYDRSYHFVIAVWSAKEAESIV
jgi:hypothetical protein